MTQTDFPAELKNNQHHTFSNRAPPTMTLEKGHGLFRPRISRTSKDACGICSALPNSWKSGDYLFDDQKVEK